ncbi:uncharacterized protein Tco025E_03053 [Trypanosoma conorhini]|uniref:Uncharacterized protein n=1 Tax=Trypanosoma conorhini TaxID=83891 RepID=A0A422PXX0_9TRYP|nr:uncharacterized protein Tco025E_03053 [Trypanosoma conorhini]RNF22566.1 hypothetical protein Tco025E_03053 [Trypanosoma conorhini]
MAKGDMHECGFTLTYREGEKQSGVTAVEEEQRSLSKSEDAFLMGTSMSVDSQADTCGKPPPLLDATMDPVFNKSGTEKGQKEQCEFNASTGDLRLEAGSEDAAGAQGVHAMVSSTPCQPQGSMTTPIAERVGAIAGSVWHDMMHAQPNFQATPKLTLQSRLCSISPRKPNASREGGLIPSSNVFSMSPGTVAPFTPTLMTALTASRNRSPRIPYLPPKTWEAHPTHNLNGPNDTAKDTSPMFLQDSSRGGEGSVGSSTRSPFALKQPSLSTAGVSSLSFSSRNCNMYPLDSLCSVSTPSKLPSSNTEHADGKGSVHQLFLPESVAVTNKGNCYSASRGGANCSASGNASNQSSKLQQPTPSLSFPLLVSLTSNDSRGSENPLRIAKNGRCHCMDSVSVSGQRLLPHNGLGHRSPQAMAIVPPHFRRADYSHTPHQPRRQEGMKTRSVQELLVQEVVSQLRQL